MSGVMKRIGLISLIVAAAGLVVGLLAFFGGAQTGVRVSRANGVELLGGETGGELVLAAQDSLEAFGSLNVRVNFATVEVVAGDGYAVELWNYQSGGKTLLHYELSGGVLSIWDVRRGQSGGSAVYFGFNFPSEWKQPLPNRVTVTVPQGAELDVVSVSADLSDAVLRGWTANSLEFSSSFGTLTVGDLHAGRAVLKTDSVDIDLARFTADALEVRNNFGRIALESDGTHRFGPINLRGDSCDISLSGVRTDALGIKNNFGPVVLRDVQTGMLDLDGDSCDITFETVSADGVDIDNNFGEIQLSKLITNRLTVDGDSCDVTVEGALRGAVVVHNNFGSVTLRSSLARGEYDLDLNASFGNIQVDGAGVSGDYREVGENRPHSIAVQNDSGDVSLFFGG